MVSWLKYYTRTGIFHFDGSTSVLPTIRLVLSGNIASPSNRPLDGIARPPAVRTEQCSTASEYGGIEEWPTVKTRPDRAQSRRCNWSEAPPFVNKRPFLMSSVCGSTEPNTSVPMIASVPVARLQIIMGNSVCNPMNDTTQLQHPSRYSDPRSVCAAQCSRSMFSMPSGAPAHTRV